MTNTNKQSRRRNIKDQYKLKHIQLPKILFYKEKYKGLSLQAKVAYGFLQDRWNLSLQTNWIDENGDIYFLYSNEKLMKILNVKSKSTFSKIKKELINAELLEQVQQGLKKPNILYLLEPEFNDKDIYEMHKQEQEDIADELEKNNTSFSNQKKAEKTMKPVEPQGSPKIERPFSENRSPKIERQEVQKSNTINTNITNTYKDNKDNKDNLYQQQNNEIVESLYDTFDYETKTELIENHIYKYDLERLYGQPIIQLFKKHSKTYEHFTTYSNILYHAHKKAEEENNYFYNLTDDYTEYADKYKSQLKKTFTDVLEKEQKGKINSTFLNYLFVSLKNDFARFAALVKDEEEGNLVPTYNWLEDISNE